PLLELASNTLAVELEPRHISVGTVDPGDIRTRIHHDAFPDEDISDRRLPEVTLPFGPGSSAKTPSESQGCDTRHREPSGRSLREPFRTLIRSSDRTLRLRPTRDAGTRPGRRSSYSIDS